MITYRAIDTVTLMMAIEHLNDHHWKMMTDCQKNAIPPDPTLGILLGSLKQCLGSGAIRPPQSVLKIEFSSE
jgi:hypothetical protein